MLSKIEITNYRGFDSYEAKGLARVNLFVGKNNSGKTALLEGIQFLTAGGDPAVIAEAAQRRGELIVNRPDISPTVDIAHFFHGHALSLELGMSFRGDNGYVPIVMKVFAPKEPSESKQRAGGLFLKISGPYKSERDEPRFAVSSNGGVDLDVPASRFRRLGLPRRAGPQVRFVGPESLNSAELAEMWDVITITGQEIDIAAALRILDSNLESLHFLTGIFSSGYFPSRGGIIAGMKGQEARVPLGSMGDGMRRLLAIATALAFTKDGCLFIDEVDTGLHYSVMTDMWKMIISKAIAAKSQVFATTHSWDCIAGLSVLCQSYPELLGEVAIHKIDRSLKRSVCFAGDTLANLVKSHIDPR